MALLKFLKGNYSNLSNAAINEGQILICNDTAEMFVDVAADKRIKIGDFTVVGTIAELEALDATKVPTSRLYYVENGNILARSNGTSWVQINKQPTAEEMKTLLGLGTLAYKSEVAEGDLNADLAAKINAASGAQHAHDNKGVLDGITSDKVTAWDNAEKNAKDHADGLNTAMNTRVEALEAIDHDHANKAELDLIATGDKAKWDATAEKAHTHTFNETELNKIAEGDVAKWNAAEQNAKDYADGLDGAMNTRVEALETAIGENGSVATQIKTAIEALDFTDVAVDGEYVSAVNEVDGKISVTRKALPDYSNTYDAKGAADTAFENAKAYADGLAANYDEKGAAAGVKTELEAEIAKKVDKVEGKSLVLDTEITKLAGISEGANKVEASANNGSIKIDGVETVVYTHPASHTVSEISDFDEKVKAYDYATKTEAQGYADAKDEAIAAAKKAGDDAQDAIDAYIESNNTALAGVKATADAAAVKTEVEAALADRYTKSEADGKFAVKGEDSYDDTALAGRVTAAEGKITALETESAKHALKTELEAVDKKFEDYTKTADLPTDLGDFTNNAGYAKTADVNIELDKKADKTQVATDIANAIAPLATTEALNGVKATAEAAAVKTEVEAALALKADKSVVDAMYTNAQIDGFIAEAKKYADDNDADTKYGIVYDSENKKIKLVEGGTDVEIDASAFIKDGMISNVTIGNDNDLIITFNTDAGKENIVLPLDQLVDIYTGVEGDRIKVTVNADKSITADLVAGSIGKDYLDDGVKASLALADTALQSHQDISHLATKEELNAAKTEAANQDAVILAEAQKYADTAKADAIADAATKYETIGTAQGIVDGLKLSETYEPIGAEGRAIAAAEGKVNELAGNVYTKAEVENLLCWGEF